MFRRKVRSVLPTITKWPPLGAVWMNVNQRMMLLMVLPDRTDPCQMFCRATLSRMLSLAFGENTHSTAAPSVQHWRRSVVRLLQRPRNSIQLTRSILAGQDEHALSATQQLSSLGAVPDVGPGSDQEAVARHQLLLNLTTHDGGEEPLDLFGVRYRLAGDLSGDLFESAFYSIIFQQSAGCVACAFASGFVAGGDVGVCGAFSLCDELGEPLMADVGQHGGSFRGSFEVFLQTGVQQIGGQLCPQHLVFVISNSSIALWRRPGMVIM